MIFATLEAEAKARKWIHKWNNFAPVSNLKVLRKKSETLLAQALSFIMNIYLLLATTSDSMILKLKEKS